MALLDKFKSLFTKKTFPEKSKETVKLSDALKFLKKYSDESKILKEIEDIKTQITEKKQEIQELITTLEKAEIPKNIHESNAVKTKVNSNRTAYITSINILFNKLESRDDFEPAFKEFSEKSLKPYHITQYLFGKELKPLAEAIQELSKLFLNKKSLNEETKNSKFKKIENDILLLQDTLRNKKTIKQELEILEKEIKSKDLTSLERKYVSIKNSKEYEDLLKERETAQHDLRASREAIVEFFSDIKRSLKKANNKKKSWIVQYYIDEPIDAIQEDTEFKLIIFVNDLKQEDVEKEDFTKIKTITNEKLSTLRHNYTKSLEDSKKIEKKHALETALTDLEDQMYKIKSQKAALSKKLDELKSRNLVNPEELKKQIENALTEISNILVEIEI